MSNPEITLAPEAQLADYEQFVHSIKTRIAQAHQRAVLSVNTELIDLYWEIGRERGVRQYSS